MEIELMTVETKLGVWTIYTNTNEMNPNYEYFIIPPTGYNFNTAHALFEGSISDCYSHIDDENLHPCNDKCGCFFTEDAREDFE